jgi:excisionase family DNA binding protein
MACTCEKDGTTPRQIVRGGSGELIRVEEAAELLDSNPWTVRRLLADGKIRGVKVGQQWRVNLAALRAFAGLD